MPNGNIIAAVLVCLTMSAGVYAQQKGKGGTLTALDYAEIQQLYVRYNYGIDTHAENGMMWARTFTLDGTFVIVGSSPVQGHDKLAEFAKAKPNTKIDAPHHFATNIMIEPSADGARGSAYFFNVPTPEPNKPATITGTGTYQDELARTAEGWRFKKRTFYSNALPPSMIGRVSSRYSEPKDPSRLK